MSLGIYDEMVNVTIEEHWQRIRAKVAEEKQRPDAAKPTREHLAQAAMAKSEAEHSTLVPSKMTRRMRTSLCEAGVDVPYSVIEWNIPIMEQRH